MLVTFFLMSISSMSHVDFKKCLCGYVDFKGQWPLDKSHSRLRDGYVCNFYLLGNWPVLIGQSRTRDVVNI